jgi:site-specific DNA recombinase
VRRKFGIYVRVSGDRGDNHTSPDTQEEICRKRLAEMGIDASEPHVVREVFTAKYWFERDKLQWLIKEVSVKHIDGFIAFKLDRVSRDQAHLGVLMTTFQRHNGELLLAAETFDDTPEGKLLMAMKGYQAEQERITTAYRTRIGSEARVKNKGLYPGTYKAPIGWRYVEGTKRGRLEHNPEEVKLLHRFRDEILSGTSLRQFCLKLTAEGVPTPRGARIWNAKTLRAVLDNPLYVGKPAAFRTSRHRREDDPRHFVVDRKGPDEWVALPEVEPIFTEAEVAAMKARLLESKSESKRNNPSPEETLLRSGIVRCGYCDRPLRVHRGQNRGSLQVQYQCNRTARDMYGCPGFAVDTRILDSWVWDRVVGVLRDPQLILDRLSVVKEENPLVHQIAAMGQRLGELTEQMYDLSREVATLKSAAARALVLQQMDQLGEEHDQVTQMLADKERELVGWEQARRFKYELIDWCRVVADRVDRLPMETRRRFLQALSVRVWLWRADHEPRWRMRLRLDPTGDFVWLDLGEEETIPAHGSDALRELTACPDSPATIVSNTPSETTTFAARPDRARSGRPARCRARRRRRRRCR